MYCMYNLFVAASKTKAARNETGLIMYAHPPINNRIKHKTSFEFLFFFWLIALIKNIKQNIGENIVSLVLRNHY